MKTTASARTATCWCQAGKCHRQLPVGGPTVPQAMSVYAIRAHLETSGPVACPPAAPVVRDGLEHGFRGPARLSHARIRVTPQAVDAVAFVVAGSLLDAEDGLREAWQQLTTPDSVLSGWHLLHCEADSRLALGLYELPSLP